MLYLEPWEVESVEDVGHPTVELKEDGKRLGGKHMQVRHMHMGNGSSCMLAMLRAAWVSSSRRDNGGCPCRMQQLLCWVLLPM